MQIRNSKICGRAACAIAIIALAALLATGARAETCRAEDFAAAVDKAGAALRTFNAEAKPRLTRKLDALGARKGWPKAEREQRGYEYLADDRIAEFDAKANDLLGKVDDLGSVRDGAAPDCARLGELEGAGGQLLAVMKDKSQYSLDRIDRELGIVPVAPKPPAAAVQRRESWSTTTAEAPRPEPPAATPPPPPTAALPPAAFETAGQGYTIDEIREATRGFFGTISTELGSVIEHAFSKSGRPTAYILGSEGGGAFLAGLRYGEGTLYLRAGGTRKIYWHGPSIGGDIGAEGARTLYLIYRLKEPDGLYRRFAGIDGSAYFVGGVGITFLKGGEVIMAPIRSGIGLRLGASVGYVRFTPHKTWNPF